MKNNRIMKNYASILLVLFVIGLLLTGTLSTAYAAEYQTISDLNGKRSACRPAVFTKRILPISVRMRKSSISPCRRT